MSIEVSDDGTASSRKGVSLFESANENLLGSINRIPVAWLLARLSIRHRYQRSLLGPFWITISQAIYILVLGLVFGTIFKQKNSDFLPFVTCGALVIGWISATLQESSSALITKAPKIREGDRYIFAHICELVFRNLLIFGHHLVILVVVLLIFRVPVSVFDVPVALFGCVLLLWNLTSLSFLVSIATLRYRDLGPLVASVLRILFFLTPIMWEPSFLGDKEYLVDFNPLHHWINLVREPLTNGDYRFDSLLITIITATVFSVAAYLVFVFSHRKISLWL